uniref:PDZ and LIM domain protein 1 n=1 Tax=Moschus moschiferus TaxID=68415 RepID=A0A8C6DJA0_MOSMO
MPTRQGLGPWGFHLLGGKDFEQSLAISWVNPGSKAAVGNLCVGDVITAIDGENTSNMTHLEAQNKIKGCTDNMILTAVRPERKIWSPLVTEEGKRHPNKINLASEPQEALHVGSTPAAVLESEVYKRPQEKQELNEPLKQSTSFLVLQEILESEGKVDPNKSLGFRSVEALVTKVAASIGNAQKLLMCDRCGTRVVGVFMKLQDYHHHPECYLCTDYGTNRKEKGHFLTEDQIYCEKHAGKRVTPFEGYDVVTVFPK